MTSSGSTSINPQIVTEKPFVKWMQSNSSAPIVFDMYKDYKIDVVTVNRSISASAGSRKPVTETIITNYTK